MKKLYVHFDPAWGAKHIDPAFPLNAHVSFFWTNAHSRRMFDTHIPADIAHSFRMLPLPDEKERARLRLIAEQNPSHAPDPRMEQLELLARHARQWHVYAIPAGGIRHTVWFNAQGMGHIDEHGRPQAWNMQPRMRVPPDTVLDVVYSNGCMYVLDAWSLPSPADLFVHRTRPRLLERVELAQLLVESCEEPRLKLLPPTPLLEWKQTAHIQEAVGRAQQYDPAFDLFFLRDGKRPPASTSYSWSARDETTFQQVDQLITYVISKQLPVAPSHGAAAPAAHPRQPPIAVAAASSRP